MKTMGTLLHNFHFSPHDSLNYRISPFPRLSSSFFNVRLPIKNNQISCNKLRMDSVDKNPGNPENGVAQIDSKKIVIPNSHQEKLVGLLHETGSREIIVLCHGFRSNKNNQIMNNVADAIEKEGISAFRFDFSGNGESEGSFYYGNYNHEADDLHSVIQYFSNINRVVPIILGHSKGGDVVLLYASKYQDIRNVINLSGRYDLKTGIRERLGEDYLERIKQQGFIDVEDGKSGYRVTEESLVERLGTDMHEACLKIDKECRVLTVHGSDDEVIPVEDAKEFAKIIPNHKLEIVEGADHCYNQHQSQLVSTVMEFIKTVMEKNN